MVFLQFAGILFIQRSSPVLPLNLFLFEFKLFPRTRARYMFCYRMGTTIIIKCELAMNRKHLRCWLLVFVTNKTDSREVVVLLGQLVLSKTAISKQTFYR